MRGLVNKLFLVLFAIFSFVNPILANEKVGIVTDTLLTPVTYYNAYYRTPEFFAQDIRLFLMKRGIDVVALDEVQTALKKSGIRQYDLQSLQGLQQGYNIEYPLLKKIAKQIDVKK